MTQYLKCMNVKQLFVLLLLTVREIKTVQKTSCVNVNASDDNGWTVLHHIAAPLSNGSFDNHQMVYVLHTVGLNLNTTNQDGDTALDLAVRSGAARVARMIQKLNNVNEKDMVTNVFVLLLVEKNIM